MKFYFFLLLLPFSSCQSQTKLPTTKIVENESSQSDTIETFYEANKGNDLPSKSIGSVSNGSLVNGKLLPFSGTNFRYFDTTSYLYKRAFVHDQLLKSVLSCYKECEIAFPSHSFCIMECSNEKGGKIAPHHTHQNGLSIDFMTPLLKDGKAYYALDSLGAEHYLLEFDAEGKNSVDKTIEIDFETVAHHLWILEQAAHKNGLKISKVIWKLELKDKLFATEYGKKLKAQNIYFAQNLTPIINSLHDNHYHVDFEFTIN
jgi:penicillin-insensitive murein endopeptidase